MLQDLLRRWEVDPKACVMVGDQPTDMAAADAAGVDGFRFLGGNLDEFIRKEVLF
jgi:D-glycero-D-manno-heptose 1,7-bisphosphate phosphatase